MGIFKRFRYGSPTGEPPGEKMSDERAGSDDDRPDDSTSGDGEDSSPSTSATETEPT